MKKLILIVCILINFVGYSQRPKAIYKAKNDSISLISKALDAESDMVISERAEKYRRQLLEYQKVMMFDKKHYLIMINGWPSRRDLTKINPYLVRYITEKKYDGCPSDKAPKAIVSICLLE
jgi:hypothetical protein